MSYSQKYRVRAIALRQKGYSIKEIAKIMGISVSSSSFWCSTVKINQRAKNKLATKQKISLIRANKVLNDRREKIETFMLQNAKREISSLHFSKSLYKLLCAIFIWTEGGKSAKYRVSFTNSDPVMMQTFLTLFRASFDVDETKFRGLIHIHEYHNEGEIKNYWSSLTKIPLNQFHKSFQKINTKKRKHPNYKGCMNMTYYDSKVAHELRALYNTFARKLVRDLKILS